MGGPGGARAPPGKRMGMGILGALEKLATDRLECAQRNPKNTWRHISAAPRGGENRMGKGLGTTSDADEAGLGVDC